MRVEGIQEPKRYKRELRQLRDRRERVKRVQKGRAMKDRKQRKQTESSKERQRTELDNHNSSYIDVDMRSCFMNQCELNFFVTEIYNCF